MKILFVSCSALPIHQSGVASWIDSMAKRLSSMGHTVTVFTAEWNPKKRRFSRRSYRLHNYSVETVNFPIKIDGYFDFYRDDNVINASLEPVFNKVLEKQMPDVVHFHAMQGMGMNLIRLAKERQITTVLSVHDWWLACPNMFMTDCFGVPCDVRIANQEQCGDCLNHILKVEGSQDILSGFRAEDFWKRRFVYLKWVVEHDVDIVLPASRTLEQFLRDNHFQYKQLQVFEIGIEQLGETPNKSKPKEHIVFGYVGNAVKAKGIWLLLEAVSELKADHWRMHLYGDGCTSENADVMQYIKDNKIGRNVSLMGPFLPQDKRQVYSQMDVLVIPSLCRESYSIAAREALASAVPVLTSACGGVEEVITDGVNGWVVERNDAAALRDKMDALLLDSTAIGDAAEQTKRTHISYCDGQAQELIRLYQNLKTELNDGNHEGEDSLEKTHKTRGK